MARETVGWELSISSAMRLLALLALLDASSGFSLSPAVRSGSLRHSSPAASSLLMAERTYIMIKPDGVQRGLVGTIIGRFEQRGYKLQALKLYQASEELLRTHYSDLVEKKFFPSLLEYMLSGPVTCMVWEGKNVVKMGRQMLGATNPQESLPGTIRGDFSIDVGRNICHGSDSVENAEKEIALCTSNHSPRLNTIHGYLTRYPYCRRVYSGGAHRLGGPFERMDL